MNASEKRRICELAGRLFDESIEDAEFQELEALLGQDSASREWYQHCMQQNVLLDERLTSPDAAPSRDAVGLNAPSRHALAQFNTYLLALAASVVLLIGATVVALTKTSTDPPRNTGTYKAAASQPTVEYLQDSVKLSYDDGTVALVEQPARFRLDGNNRLFLHSGKVVARRGEVDSDFAITLVSHTFKPQAGEFGISVADGEPELHVFDGVGELESNGRSSAHKVTRKRVTPGGVYRIDSSGQLSPSLISEMAEFPSRVAGASGGIVDSFAPDVHQRLSGWKGAWFAPESAQTVWEIKDSNPLTRRSGAFLSVSRHQDSVDGTHEIAWRGERRELEASHIRLSRQYESTDSFSPNESHTIEFLFRLESDPRDLLRVAMFSGPAQVDLEPLPGERSWHIHAGVPPESSFKKKFVWFLRDTTREDKFQFMEMKQGATYRVFIEVDPKKRDYRCTISDGVNVIYNNNKRGLPTYKKNASVMEAIHLFAWGKPGKECRFSVDEFLIRNSPKPKAIEP